MLKFDRLAATRLLSTLWLSTMLLACSSVNSVALAEAPLLADCPSSPNCVSSLATDAEHQIAPLVAGTDAASAFNNLTAVLDSLPRVSWQAPSEQRIEAEFTSRLLRFVDDVHFVIGDDGVVQVRSASRIGYSDFGANRKRVEMLREALQQQQASAATVN